VDTEDARQPANRDAAHPRGRKILRFLIVRRLGLAAKRPLESHVFGLLALDDGIAGNLIAGVILPALIFGLAPTHGAVLLELGWLLGLTLAALLLTAPRRGLNRIGGLAIVALYLAFVGVRVYLG